MCVHPSIPSPSLVRNCRPSHPLHSPCVCSSRRRHLECPQISAGFVERHDFFFSPPPFSVASAPSLTPRRRPSRSDRIRRRRRVHLLAPAPGPFFLTDDSILSAPTASLHRLSDVVFTRSTPSSSSFPPRKASFGSVSVATTRTLVHFTRLLRHRICVCHHLSPQKFWKSTPGTHIRSPPAFLTSVGGGGGRTSSTRSRGIGAAKSHTHTELSCETGAACSSLSMGTAFDSHSQVPSRRREADSSRPISGPSDLHARRLGPCDNRPLLLSWSPQRRGWIRASQSFERNSTACRWN